MHSSIESNGSLDNLHQTTGRHVMRPGLGDVVSSGPQIALVASSIGFRSRFPAYSGLASQHMSAACRSESRVGGAAIDLRNRNGL